MYYAVYKASQLGALGRWRIYIVHVVRRNFGSAHESLNLDKSEPHVVVMTEQYQNAKWRCERLQWLVVNV